MMFQKKKNIKEHNINRPETPDHPYKIVIIGGSGFRKINSLFNLISQQTDINNIYLYSKDFYHIKYQF